jgi:hypothetical protein
MSLAFEIESWYTSSSGVEAGLEGLAAFYIEGDCILF